MDGHCQPKRIARTHGRSNGDVGETEQQANDYLSRLLPDDMLADVLRRLAPRCLAVSRCVCNAWRDMVDTRRLLRADLLPLWLDGIIVEFSQHEYSPEFFSRPRLPVSGKLENLTAIDVWDHCNGLLLCYDTVGVRYGYVSNPATGWKVRLPPCLAMKADFYHEHLVFDPAVSTHYEVLKNPHLEGRLDRQRNPPLLEESEWPPSQFVMQVFSSVTWTWEKRTFSREGEAAGTVAEIRSNLGQDYDYLNSPRTVYWRGALYVNCLSDFLMRICLSDNKYRIIKPPLGIGVNGHPALYLARSKKGVYFASLCPLRIRVWILDESCGHLEWVLMHENKFKSVIPRYYSNRQVDGPWILQTVKGLQGSPEAIPGEKFEWNCPLRKDNFEWNSDGDVDPVLDCTYMFQADTVDILGFHPYKEIVFLRGSSDLGLAYAYHLNSSRFQVLGSLSGTGMLLDDDSENLISVAFPYTPCWIEEFTGNN